MSIDLWIVIKVFYIRSTSTQGSRTVQCLSDKNQFLWCHFWVWTLVTYLIVCVPSSWRLAHLKSPRRLSQTKVIRIHWRLYWARAVILEHLAISYWTSSLFRVVKGFRAKNSISACWKWIVRKNFIWNRVGIQSCTIRFLCHSPIVHLNYRPNSILTFNANDVIISFINILLCCNSSSRWIYFKIVIWIVNIASFFM